MSQMSHLDAQACHGAAQRDGTRTDGTRPPAEMLAGLSHLSGVVSVTARENFPRADGWPDGEPYGPRELWAPLPGWPHEVSNVGGRHRSAAGKILAQRASNRPVDGPPYYQLVTLCCGGRKQTFSVHANVLKAHRPHRDAAGNIAGDGRPPGLEASHVDDVPDHNSLVNLVWETHEANEQRKLEAVRLAASRAAHAARARQRAARLNGEIPHYERSVIEHVSGGFWRRVLRRLRGHRA